ncbi:MAG: hypothetical protein WD768_23215 [Phycisphaeraceae bacterium]
MSDTLNPLLDFRSRFARLADAFDRLATAIPSTFSSDTTFEPPPAAEDNLLFRKAIHDQRRESRRLMADAGQMVIAAHDENAILTRRLIAFVAAHTLNEWGGLVHTPANLFGLYAGGSQVELETQDGGYCDYSVQLEGCPPSMTPTVHGIRDQTRIALGDLTPLSSEQCRHYANACRDLVHDLKPGTMQPIGDQPLGRIERADDISRFKKDGDIWDLAFAGQSAKLKASVNIARLAYLIERRDPQKPVEAIDFQLVEGNGTIAGLAGVRADAASSRSRDEVLDGEARHDIAEEITECKMEAANAESQGRVEDVKKWKKKVDDLMLQLKQAAGLGGRTKLLGKAAPAGAAAKSIKVSLDRGINQIRIAGMSALADHLRRAICQDGTAFAYRPDPHTPAWQI